MSPCLPTIAGSRVEISFPVARHHVGHHLGGALGNRRHIGDLAPSIRPPRPRPTRLMRLTQCGQQFAPQGAAGHNIQRRINGLGQKLFAHVVRIRAVEASGNLFGRASLSQMRSHTLAIVHNVWPQASPRLKVSRSSALMWR